MLGKANIVNPYIQTWNNNRKKPCTIAHEQLNTLRSTPRYKTRRGIKRFMGMFADESVNGKFLMYFVREQLSLRPYTFAELEGAGVTNFQRVICED